MKKYFLVIFLVLIEAAVYWFASAISLADTPLAKELTITQIKITGDEFVVLHNATVSNLQLGNFWLQYFNDFNLANSGVSNSSAQLPSVTLQPGQEILLAVGTAANCGPVWVSKLPFSLKDSAGTLQVLAVSQAVGIIGYKPEDQVSWSSKTTDSVDIKGVSSSAVAQIYYKAGSAWLSTASPPGCSAVGTTTSSSTNTPATLAQSNTSPPSVVLSAVSAESAGPVMPAADIGLTAPQLSELLPNPASPQSDATDEFIELYNPNNAPFDLSGFTLRTGTTTTHDFKFPSGQFILQPHEFRAFYAPQTGLTLANDGSKAELLDPSGNVLAQTDIYSTAKDAYAWVYAEGLWQWTTTSTPNAANVITAPPVSASSKKTAAPKTTSKAKSATKGAKTTAATASPANGAPSTGTNTSSLHPMILAGIGGIALLYALYEYRHDLANQLYRFRRNREAGRSVGKAAETAGSFRTLL